MKKVLRKALVMVLATAMLVTCSEMRNVYAEEETEVESTGGSYGKMYYDLSTEGNSYYIGTSMYRLKATSIQKLPNGGSYVPISSINYNAVIYYESGSECRSSASFTTRDASWYSDGVAEVVLISTTRKGFITHVITSEYYGTITRMLTNE